MTDRELAGCALSEVLALLEKATPGEWTADGVEAIAPDDCDLHSLAEFQHGSGCRLEDEAEANSAAACASVNFLRQHGPALLAAISTTSSEVDGERLDLLRRIATLEADVNLLRYGIALDKEIDAEEAAWTDNLRKQHGP